MAEKLNEYAVFRSGSYQFLASPGERFAVPKLKMEPGSEIRFDEVLLLRSGDSLSIGQPRVAGAYVAARVVEHTRRPKVTIMKFIRRENYRRKKGHKQPVTVVEITGIERTG